MIDDLFVLIAVFVQSVAIVVVIFMNHSMSQIQKRSDCSRSLPGLMEVIIDEAVREIDDHIENGDFILVAGVESSGSTRDMIQTKKEFG